jgi:hypothetical protein
VRCCYLFREEAEGEKISRTQPKPCACTNSFWYGSEEERVNSNPSMHKLTLFYWEDLGRGGREVCAVLALVFLQGRGGREGKKKAHTCAGSVVEG